MECWEAEEFDRLAQPVLREAGARIEATFVTERGPNTFARLPVREGETVFVWLASFQDELDYSIHLDRLAQMPL